jgi:hypothetical protein
MWLLWNEGDKFEGLDTSNPHLGVRRYRIHRHKYSRL